MARTQSQIQAFQDCQKFFYWKNRAKLVPNGAAAEQNLGTAVHKALEVWMTTEDWAKVLVAYHGYKASLGENDFVMGLSMLEGYKKKWGRPSEKYEVIKVEKEFEITFDGDVEPFRGKIDVILKNRETGETELWDHKTVTSYTPEYIIRRWMDLQLHAYYIGATEGLGIPIHRFVYDVLVKPGVRRKKGETVGEYSERCVAELSDENFDRVPFAVDPVRVASVRRNIAIVSANIEIADQTGAYAENVNHCFAYNRPCDYWHLCVSHGSKLVRDNGYTVAAENPELSMEVKPDGNRPATGV